MKSERTIFTGPASQCTNAGEFAAAVVFGLGAVLVWMWLSAAGAIPALRWLALSALPILGAYAVVVWWRVRFTIYRITDARIEVERGLIAKRIENLDLFRVRDIRLRIGLIDRLLGIGDVIVETTDENAPTMRLIGIRRPRTLYDELKVAALDADRSGGVVHVERQSS